MVRQLAQRPGQVDKTVKAVQWPGYEQQTKQRLRVIKRSWKEAEQRQEMEKNAKRNFSLRRNARVAAYRGRNFTFHFLL